jgi:hypothetical protein
MTDAISGKDNAADLGSHRAEGSCCRAPFEMNEEWLQSEHDVSKKGSLSDQDTSRGLWAKALTPEMSSTGACTSKKNTYKARVLRPNAESAYACICKGSACGKVLEAGRGIDLRPCAKRGEREKQKWEKKAKK